MIQIRRRDFPLQSFPDGTLANGLVAQPPNDLIVNAQKEQVVGNSFTLHPASATPIAIRPLGGRAGANNAPMILTPGATFRPGKTFDAFEWGLPFGWLGGGLAMLYIGLDEKTEIDWQSRRPEVCFHRIRLPITADDGVLDTVPNWPLRFPWLNATLTSGLNQGGKPMLDVLPTRTVVVLRGGTPTAPATMRMVWTTQNQALDLAEESAGIDLDWPGLNPAPATGMNPTIELPHEHLLYGGDTTILTLKDLSGTAALTGLNVQLYRFGTL